MGIDDLDEGYFVQQAARVLHGQLPYRDFETLYTPGLAYVHAALFAAQGGATLVAPRVLALAARAGVALLLYVLTLPVVRQPVLAAAPGLVLLVGLDDAPVRWEPHPGWLSTVFALLAVRCLTHRRRTGWLVAAGLAVAATYAIKQNTGAFLLLAVLLWCGWPRLLVPLATFAAATLLWLVPLAFSVGNLGQLAAIVGAVNQAGLVSPPEPTILIPLSALVASIWLVRRDSNPRLRWYLIAGIALFLTEYPRMDTLHLAWSAPLLLVLGTVALDRRPPLIGTLVLVWTVWLLLPTWSGRLGYLADPLAPVAGVEAPLATATSLNGVVSEIQQRTGPGEPIFVYPTSPLLYVLAERPNPTRWDHLNPGSADARQIDQVIADLQRANVRLIVMSDFWQGVWGPPLANASLEDWINAHFREVARHGAYRVLAADL